MAKGITNQPLRIWVAAQWKAHPAIAKLRQQGHEVFVMADGYGLAQDGRELWAATEPDLILHPAAHWWGDEMFVEETRANGEKYTPYLDAAITAGRKRKREGKAKC